MILLDAFALVAYLTGEPAAGEVEQLLRGGDCAVGAVNLAEVADVATRVRGVTVDEARRTMGALIHTRTLAVLPATEGVAWLAAELRVEMYDKRSQALSLADCLLLATAEEGDEIATSDPAVAAVARSQGIAVIPLEDSTGARP